MANLNMKTASQKGQSEEHGDMEKVLESKNVQLTKQLFKATIEQNRIPKEVATAAALSLVIENMPDSFKNVKKLIESKTKDTVATALRPFVPNMYSLERISFDQNLIVASYTSKIGDSGIAIKIDLKSARVNYEISFKF